MIAAAGVSLSKQTMHRTHGPKPETPCWGACHLGRKTLRRKYARRFWYTPFAVGAALICAAYRGVKPKIEAIFQAPNALKMPVKPIVLLCLPGLSGINM